MQKREAVLTALTAAVLLFGLSFFAVFFPGAAYSVSERRPLASLPVADAQSLASGRFMADFETYATDRFPARDAFRALKAAAVRGFFLRRDDHGIYRTNGHLSKIEYPKKDAMLQYAAALFTKIYERDLQNADCRVYLAVVPDKGRYLAAENGYPAMDYAAFAADFAAMLPFAQPIGLMDTLSETDFYRTDSHWKQECLQSAAERLADGMGAILRDTDYTVHTLETPFYGVYAGQYALPVKPDTVRYLTSETLSACKVTDLSSGTPRPGVLYDFPKARGRDPYEFFLSGARALCVIENPNAETDRSLVLFRDSYAGALAPLLVSGYAEVTLVDLRYIRSELVPEYVSFDNADVLFLYSTTILNDSLAMK